MSLISFTGSSKRLSRTERGIVRSTVESLAGPVEVFFSGAGRGVDIESAGSAIEVFPESKHVILIPTWAPTRTAPPRTCKHDRAGIAALSKLAAELGVFMEWRWCEPGIGDEATGLLRRDDFLAVNCTHMVGWPETLRELQRSGTWATIRRARRLNRQIKIVPLDGGRAKVER